MAAEYVETSATGTATAAPDVAVVTVRFESVAGGVAAALDSCAATATHALAALDDSEVAHTRQTGQVAVRTHWDQARGVEHGFEASQSLVVRLTDTAGVGAVLTALSDAAGDALRVDGLGWTFSDTEAVHAQAREAAVGSARAKAEQLARLGGRTLGPLLRVREGAGSEISAGAAKRESVVAVSMAMPAEPGQTALETTVTCRWLLTG